MTTVKAAQDHNAQWEREHVSPKLPSFAVASLPAASGLTGHFIHCSNGAGGSPCLAYSNGTNWLRITLGAACSAT